MKECDVPACGALWLDPRPTPASIQAAYRRYYTHALPPTEPDVAGTALFRMHAAQRFGFSPSRLPIDQELHALLSDAIQGWRHEFDLVARYLPAAAFGSGRLLDVGCGNGYGLDYLAAIGWRVSGVEVDPKAAAGARQRGVDVRVGRLRDVGFAENSFDAVTSSHVIEHVHEPLEFLRESRRVLKAGGTLVAVTPNAHAPGHARHGRHWRSLEPPRHLTLFTRAALGALASAADLRDVRVLMTPRALASGHIESRKIASDDRGGARFPARRARIEAQLLRLWEPVRRWLGANEGNELVLMASK
jgi:SAM-dependent methyltransferase